jgi:hypothetical protein
MSSDLSFMILLTMFQLVCFDVEDSFVCLYADCFEYVDSYPGNCDRAESEQFLKDNASFIDY